MFQLKGKVAVVTGAGSGFGRAFARALADFGATVICAGRRVEALQATAATIAESRGRAFSLALDVTDTNSVEAFWHAVAREHGGEDAPKVGLVVGDQDPHGGIGHRRIV